MQLPNRILIGLVAGATAGVTVNLLTGAGPVTQKRRLVVTEPVGRMWLSALIMVVIPLILSTLSLGVAGLGDLKRLGRIGLVTLAASWASPRSRPSSGLTVMNTSRPGTSLDPAVKTELMETYRGQAGEAMGLATKAFSIDLLVKIVPRNPVKAAATGDMLGGHLLRSDDRRRAGASSATRRRRRCGMSSTASVTSRWPSSSW